VTIRAFISRTSGLQTVQRVAKRSRVRTDTPASRIMIRVRGYAEPRARANNWSDGGVARARRRSLGRRCIRAAAVRVTDRCACMRVHASRGRTDTPVFRPLSPLPTISRHTAGIIFHLEYDRSWRGDASDRQCALTRFHGLESISPIALIDTRKENRRRDADDDNYDDEVRCARAKRRFATRREKMARV